ncbi:MAG: hypothetical protein KDA24_30355 [Deltaproteobacteria bacterium]|nr:hypothetical protein [Deltaproteobacteria bacterium]
MVSLRDGELRLLALRRRFALEGKPCREVTLAEGQRIELAPDVVLEVLEVVLPEQVLAIEGEGLVRQVLLGVSSIYTHPQPTLAPGYEADADAWIWTDGEHWTLRLRDRTERRLVPGESWSLGRRTFTAVAIALATSSQDATRIGGALERPLRIVSWYDSVELHREGESPVVIGGMPGRLLGELIAIGGPAPWKVVAAELWPHMAERNLRRSWDVTLSRLRAKLRAARIRADLVQPDGSGQVTLALTNRDTVKDHA